MYTMANAYKKTSMILDIKIYIYISPIITQYKYKTTVGYWFYLKLLMSYFVN